MTYHCIFHDSLILTFDILQRNQKAQVFHPLIMNRIKKYGRIIIIIWTVWTTILQGYVNTYNNAFTFRICCSEKGHRLVDRRPHFVPLSPPTCTLLTRCVPHGRSLLAPLVPFCPYFYNIFLPLCIPPHFLPFYCTQPSLVYWILHYKSYKWVRENTNLLKKHRWYKLYRKTDSTRATRLMHSYCRSQFFCPKLKKNPFCLDIVLISLDA